MASIKQNPKTKKWDFVFGYYDNYGVRKQVKRRGFKTKREANEKLIELQKEVQDGEYVEINKMTLGSFVKQWLENEYAMGCEETSLYNSRLYFKNHIEPKFGKVQMQSLTPSICQEFINNLYKQDYAYNSIDRICNLIKLALDKAVTYRYIKENHMRKTTMPRRSKKKELSVWTTEQVNHFLKATRGRRFHCVYALALFTGMRQGEILGLKWKDIDFERKTITINQTLTHYGKSLKPGAKTKAGIRTIAISDQLISVLKEQRKNYLELKLKLGKDFVDMDIVIFNLTNGKTVFPSNLTKSYTSDVKRAGLPHIPFHCMRHTHATMLIQRNVNVKLIADRLGHSKIGVTLDTYSHVIPSMQKEVADQVNEMITLST